MYIEILICSIVIFLVCEYSGIVSTRKFVTDYEDVLLKFKEADYDFLVKARYGGEVNIMDMYNKRVRNALLALAFSLFMLVAELSYLTVIFAISSPACSSFALLFERFGNLDSTLHGASRNR